MGNLWLVVGTHSNTHTPKEKFPTQKKSSEQTQKTPDPSYSARTVDLKRLVWFSTKVISDVIVNLGWRFHSYTITCLFLSSQEVGTHNFQGVCNDHFTLGFGVVTMAIDTLSLELMLTSAN